MRLRKAISMSEYRRRHREHGFGAEGRPRPRPRRPGGLPRRSPASAAPAAAPAPSWGPSLPVGEHLQVRAQAGYRAAVLELRPGLYLVGEIPADAVSAGASTGRLARAMVKGATASLVVNVDARGQARGSVRARGGASGSGFPSRPGLPAPPAPPAPPGPPRMPRFPVPRGGVRASLDVDVDAEAEVDVEGEDLDDLFGCDRCGGRCRG